MQNRRKRWRTLIYVIGLLVFLYWQNNHIIITNITYSNSKIPMGFDNYTIVQISDLHSKVFGNGQRGLIHKIRKAKPDVIVITGDIIDQKTKNLNGVMDLIKGVIELAPVYYVSGNHEAWSGIYDELLQQIESAGVIILENSKVRLEEGGSFIDLIGVSDPAVSYIQTKMHNSISGYTMDEKLAYYKTSDPTVLQILLSHRPEYLQIYAENQMDLVFAGHAHGGQFRIPLIGGLIAPDQGFFPKYTSGKYLKDHTTLIVSRGLGNSIIPFRIFNRPEVIKVTLKSE